MTESLMPKSARKCATCRYWCGRIRVADLHNIKCDQSQTATCNLTGQNRKAWTSCSEHESRYDF